MTDELRAKFELWATVKRRYNLERHPLRHDEYNYTSTDRAWEAWQAAHASRDAEVEALKKRIEDAPIYYIPTEKPTDQDGWVQVIGSVKAINNMRGKHVRLVIDDAMREGK